MNKFVVLILTLVVALAKTETSFKVVSSDAKSAFATPKEGYTVSYPEGYEPSRQKKFVIPPDFGTGNYGDNLWMEHRDQDDTLAIREIIVNEVYSVDTKFQWNWSVPNKKINRVRCLNIGRERAYVESVTAMTEGGPTANAYISVRKGQQMRLLVEVYTK